MKQKLIHRCRICSGDSVEIVCTEELTNYANKQPKNLPKYVYLATNGMLFTYYTWTTLLVTCEKCKEDFY